MLQVSQSIVSFRPLFNKLGDICRGLGLYFVFGSFPFSSTEGHNASGSIPLPRPLDLNTVSGSVSPGVVEHHNQAQSTRHYQFDNKASRYKPSIYSVSLYPREGASKDVPEYR